MVVIKYKKMGLGAFIGEEEMLDSWGRVVNRAELEFEEGFKIKLFHPAALGVESEAEYLVINTALDEDKTKGKIKELFPDWIEIVDGFLLVDAEELENLDVRENLFVTMDRFKGNEHVIQAALEEYKEVKNIIDYNVEKNGVKVATSSILSNTMCDIIDKILTKNGLPTDYSITRNNLVVKTENGFVDIDIFLKDKVKLKFD